MGNHEGDQVGNGHAYPRIATDKKLPTRKYQSTKVGLDISTLKQWQSERRRPYGTGRDLKTTKIQHVEGRIPKQDARTIMPQVRTTGTLGRSCQKKDGPKPLTSQTRSWQPAKQTAPWQTRPKIREIQVEQEPKQSGNDDSPQYEMG